jgi:attachment p12 family protein
MGTIITIVLSILIFGYGAYALVTGIKKEVKGENCVGCSGCSHSKHCNSHNA